MTMRKMGLGAIRVVLASGVAAFSGMGLKATVAPESVTWDWNANAAQGNTVTNALNWFDKANWGGNDAVNSGSLKANLTGNPASTRYVRADAQVSVADIVADSQATLTTNTAKKVVFISDKDFLLDRPNDINIPYYDGIMFYADVSWFKTSYPRSIIFCGDIGTAENASGSLAFAHGTPIEVRYDLYAKSSSPVRTQASGFNYVTMNAGDLTLVAPHGAAEDVTGAWNQTKDSPYVFRAGESHVLCAGTLVTGSGIPEGTFVKRIFSSDVIELSNPVTETLEANALTFAAFSPRLTQTFQVRATQEKGVHKMRFMKWRSEDDFRVTLTPLAVTAPNIDFVFDVKEGALPATTVIPEAQGKDGTFLGIFTFANCRMEFGRLGEAKNLDFVCSTSRVESANATAHLVVSNGLAATLANFTKMAGTLVKEGAGALTLKAVGTVTDYSGVTVVKEGTLTFTNENAVAIKTLAISNGATLHIPASGLRCETLVAQPGAIVCGPGALTVTTFSSDLLGITCTDGAKVLYADTTRAGDIFTSAPATNVVGVPAVWFDASKLDSFTYAEESGVNRISQWNDVRGASYMTATPTCAKKPELYVSADSTRNYVYFQHEGNVGGTSNAYELAWAQQVTGICSVFKVVGCRNGGGQFLGESSIWRNAEYSSYNYPIVCPSSTPVAVMENALFYVNGEKRDWQDGYAYAGATSTLSPEARVPQVAELHLAADKTTYAKGFASQTDSALGRNGYQDLYEIIVYTNRLTEAERLAVTGYLMKKWINAEVNYETTSQVEELDTLAAGQTLGVAAGTKVATETISGTGILSKTGDGLLYVADCNASETALNVAGGEVQVRSVSLAKEALPAGALLHLDASDASTYLATWTSGETTYLKTWGDTRGSEYGAAYVKGGNSSINPKVVSAKLNGLPMIDFGVFGTQNDNCMTTRVMCVRSFFTVQNSENGGGYLFGNTTHNCYYEDANGYYGLIRYPTGKLTDSIIWTAYDNTISKFGAGATKVRLNGEDVIGTSAFYTDGNDLLTIQCYEKVTGNSITHGNCNDPVYGGGKMVGELIYYENRLSNDETKQIEAYLAKKWFGRETAGYRQAKLASLNVAAGATFTIQGGAPVLVSSLSGKGNIAGAVQFKTGSQWNVGVGASGVDTALTITGQVDISGLSSIALAGTGKTAVGSYVLAHTGGITGNTAAITLDKISAAPGLHYALKVDGNDLVLDVTEIGLSIIIR